MVPLKYGVVDRSVTGVGRVIWGGNGTSMGGMEGKRDHTHQVGCGRKHGELDPLWEGWWCCIT